MDTLSLNLLDRGFFVNSVALPQSNGDLSRMHGILQFVRKVYQQSFPCVAGGGLQRGHKPVTDPSPHVCAP
jgi:hypothetical protein